jgi:hypothetical protein
MGYRRRARGLRRRYGRFQAEGQFAGTLSALRVMEQARRAYRSARSQGKSPKSAHNSAFNSVKTDVGAGAWDIATKVQREAGE